MWLTTTPLPLGNGLGLAGREWNVVQPEDGKEKVGERDCW